MLVPDKIIITAAFSNLASIHLGVSPCKFQRCILLTICLTVPVTVPYPYKHFFSSRKLWQKILHIVRFSQGFAQKEASKRGDQMHAKRNLEIHLKRRAVQLIVQYI